MALADESRVIELVRGSHLFTTHSWNEVLSFNACALAVAQGFDEQCILSDHTHACTSHMELTRHWHWRFRPKLLRFAGWTTSCAVRDVKTPMGTNARKNLNFWSGIPSSVVRIILAVAIRPTQTIRWLGYFVVKPEMESSSVLVKRIALGIFRRVI